MSNRCVSPLQTLLMCCYAVGGYRTDFMDELGEKKMLSNAVFKNNTGRFKKKEKRNIEKEDRGSISPAVLLHVLDIDEISLFSLKIRLGFPPENS